MTSFSRDPMFVIPAPYSGRPVCVGLVGMKRYQGAEDGCFLQKKSDTTSCLRSISLAKYLNSSVGLLKSSRAFFSSTSLNKWSLAYLDRNHFFSVTFSMVVKGGGSLILWLWLVVPVFIVIGCSCLLGGQSRPQVPGSPSIAHLADQSFTNV